MAETEAEFLRTYDGSGYEKPSVTADILVLTVGKGRRETYRQLPGF